MDSAQAKHLIETDPDFVLSKKYNYDINELLKRYPDGVPKHVCASVLMVTEDEIDEMYLKIVNKLRAYMGVQI